MSQGDWRRVTRGPGGGGLNKRRRPSGLGRKLATALMVCALLMVLLGMFPVRVRLGGGDIDADLLLDALTPALGLAVFASVIVERRKGRKSR